MISIKNILFRGLGSSFIVSLFAWGIIVSAYFIDRTWHTTGTSISIIPALGVVLIGARRIWGQALFRYANQVSEYQQKPISENIWKIQMLIWLSGLLIGLVACLLVLFTGRSYLNTLLIPWRGLILVGSISAGISIGSVIIFFWKKDQLLDNKL